jgi:hypothetical protein
MDQNPITDRIRTWYRGAKVPDISPDPHSSLVVFQLDHYEQPPLAKALRITGRFWLNHWKWIIGVVMIPLLIAFWVSA